MKITQRLTVIACLLSSCVFASAKDGDYELGAARIVTSTNAPPLTKRAGEELRGYIHRLTGRWTGVDASSESGTGRIVVRTGPDARLPKDGADPSQNFVLYEENGNQVVHGATPVAKPYGCR
jgi:hypothetical protein